MWLLYVTPPDRSGLPCCRPIRSEHGHCGRLESSGGYAKSFIIEAGCVGISEFFCGLLVHLDLCRRRYQRSADALHVISRAVARGLSYR